MSTHLTPQQISEWILGDRRREAELHVRACSLCQAELNQFEISLKEFRSSVRQWSEGQLSAYFPLQVKRNPARPWMVGLGWAMAIIILCLFVGRLSDRSGPQLQTAATTAADAALLTQIDYEVSRTVPDSMQPLTQLVSWDASSSTSTGGAHASESRTQ